MIILKSIPLFAYLLVDLQRNRVLSAGPHDRHVEHHPVHPSVVLGGGE